MPSIREQDTFYRTSSLNGLWVLALGGLFLLFAIQQEIYGGAIVFLYLLILVAPILVLGIYLTMHTRNARFILSKDRIQEFDWRNRLVDEVAWNNVVSFGEKEPPRFAEKQFLKLGTADSEFLIPISLRNGPVLSQRIISYLPSEVTATHIRRASDFKRMLRPTEGYSFGVIEKYEVTPIAVTHRSWNSVVESIEWKDVRALMFECFRLKDKHTYYANIMLLTNATTMVFRTDTRYWRKLFPMVMALIPEDAFVYLGPINPPEN